MSINLYQTGVSGLLSAQQQLATTGHNIANVNTEGYTRQRTEQGSAVGNYNGGNFVGSGTYVQDITRLYDQFSYKEQLLNKSNLGNADSISLDLNQLNEIMSFSSEAIGGAIDRFYQAVNGIADNPNDLGLRNIALSQANVLAKDFNSLNYNLDQLEKSTNGEIEQMASKISQISLDLAKINEQILQNKDLNLTGQPNDLLDKRDQLVNQLGEYTSVHTIEDTHGVMTVMIGNGATLVAGITPLTVSVEAGDPDALQTKLQLNSRNGKVALDASKLGGAIAAKIEYRDEHVAKARSELNLLAMAVSETLNQSQAKGLDLNAKQGLDIFTDINATNLQNSRVLASSKNTGTVQAGINITDVSLVPANDFTIKYDGTDYIMTNAQNGSTTTLVASSPGVYPTDYGFEFKVNSGTPSTDDRFTLRPTENSAALMKVTLTDPKSIAASSAIGVEADENNVSNGSVSIINVADPEVARSYTDGTNANIVVDVYETAPPPLPAPQTPTGIFEYRVYDAANPPPALTLATGTFAAGASAVIDMPPSPATPAFQIEIAGLPVGQGTLAREKFTISDAFGSGNATNANLMASTQEQQILGGGKQTFNQALASATAEVGSNASTAELVADTAQALFTQAYNRNQSNSGVNLDEEAANLLKYQQAYQASSQIISVANTIFDTLLAVSR
ncbi:flagellar hook-associated protein FlgK [Cognaticolwellia beringensis]|uniref:Flagellar hook-associated protein 1 n=1 Tax=Cognaticolwellia beringensis TaxID=1967665 RepID=A0A222G3T0_9GAMM|nr:flagellar hook-associated protein FlgK [Cognaticolwellia beringensis]ASP46575.1 flagellar hook-associated protein FlgK [Cognaticolwellia beringensis]